MVSTSSRSPRSLSSRYERQMSLPTLKLELISGILTLVTNTAPSTSPGMADMMEHASLRLLMTCGAGE